MFTTHVSKTVTEMSADEILLFHGVTPRQRAWLDAHLHYRVFPAGTNLMAVEQPGEVVYIILAGTVKIHIDQEDGTEVILAILGPGDTVGEMSLLDGIGRSANAITQEETSVLWMDRRSFEQCLQEMPAVASNLMRLLSNRLRHANGQIQSLATLSIHGRVAYQILHFAHRYGRPIPDGSYHIPLRLTQSDIAGLVGASRVRVNQAIVQFKRHGYISVDGDYHITVHDWKSLGRLCRSFAPPQPACSQPTNGAVKNLTTNLLQL